MGTLFHFFFSISLFVQQIISHTILEFGKITAHNVILVRRGWWW